MAETVTPVADNKQTAFCMLVRYKIKPIKNYVTAVYFFYCVCVNMF